MKSEQILDLKSEIETEIELLEWIFNIILSIDDKIVLENREDSKVYLGYEIMGYYTTAENSFLYIAKKFENNLEPERWHKSLLDRMNVGVDKTRPAVISKETHTFLNNLRGFRHCFNHYFREPLKSNRLIELKKSVLEFHPRFLAEITEFQKFLDELIENLD